MPSLNNINISGEKNDPNCGRLTLYFKSSRGLSVPQLYKYLQTAADENVVDTFNIVFNIRDCRGGKGERDIGIRAFQWLFLSYPKKFMKVVSLIPEYGRWDDLIHLWPCVLILQNSMQEAGTEHQQHWLQHINKNFGVNIKDQKSLENIQKAQLEIVRLFGKKLNNDLNSMRNSEKASLCAKWAPTENDSLDRQYKTVEQLCTVMGISKAKYRKRYTSPLREYLRITETLMCRKDWGNIDFNTVPSRAMQNLKKAFERHVPQSFYKWRSELSHSTNIKHSLPHEIISEVVSKSTPNYICQAQWRWLEDQIDETGIFSSTIPIVDTSTSMKDWGNPKKDKFPYSPMDISIGMSILISNCSTMKSRIINFSNFPTLLTLESKDIYTRCQELRNSEWASVLDFNAVFNLLLEHATKNGIVPETILVITDMSFEEAGGSSVDFTAIDTKFKSIGHKRPVIIFWNLNPDNESFCTTSHKNGSIFITGFNPSIVSSMLRGESPDPLSIMKRTLEQSRYSNLRTILS